MYPKTHVGAKINLWYGKPRYQRIQNPYSIKYWSFKHLKQLASFYQITVWFHTVLIISAGVVYNETAPLTT